MNRLFLMLLMWSSVTIAQDVSTIPSTQLSSDDNEINQEARELVKRFYKKAWSVFMLWKLYNLGAYGLKLQGLITDYTANINYGISESIQASNWLAFYQNCFVFCKKLNKKQTFGSDLDEECKQFIYKF